MPSRRFPQRVPPRSEGSYKREALLQARVANFTHPTWAIFVARGFAPPFFAPFLTRQLCCLSLSLVHLYGHKCAAFEPVQCEFSRHSHPSRRSHKTLLLVRIALSMSCLTWDLSFSEVAPSSAWQQTVRNLTPPLPLLPTHVPKEVLKGRFFESGTPFV